MASKGRFARPPEWWKHLKWQKRNFWKKERVGGKKELQEELQEFDERFED